MNLTQEKLRDWLIYSPVSGVFTWRMPAKGRSIFDPVGTINRFGHRVIMIDRKRYMVHRIAWLYVYGKWPDGDIDHINRNPDDNRISNLRDVPHSLNLINSKTRTDNTSGTRGVCWDKQKLKWKVQITIGNGKRHQKHFTSFEEASAYYKDLAFATYGDRSPYGEGSKSPAGQLERPVSPADLLTGSEQSAPNTEASASSPEPGEAEASQTK